MIDVTQPMRELAADMAVLLEMRDMIRAGKCDEGHYVQVAAKHIFAAEQRGMIAASAWQPIETAPRVGTAILLAASHGVSVGWWDNNEPTFKWRFVDDFDLTPTGCCDMESDDRVPCNGMHADTPTHWQPLPAPPAIATMSMTAGGEDA